jgi:hypothetical protein
MPAEPEIATFPKVETSLWDLRETPLPMLSKRELERYQALGERNQRALELAQNWCARLEIDVDGGVGLIEEMSGLPIASRVFRCPYARDTGWRMLEAQNAAVQFYDQNCNGCPHRQPVRLPNLLELVAVRDAERARRAEAAQSAAEEARARLDARAERRRALQSEMDAAEAGLLDLIARIDADPTTEGMETLLQVAQATPERFSAGIQEALYDLFGAAGEVRTAAALGALDLIGSDPARVVSAAVEALARVEAVPRASQMVRNRISVCSEEQIGRSLTMLIYQAASQWDSFPGRSGEPEPLIAAYGRFPETVAATLQDHLRRGSEIARHDACEAIEVLSADDPDLVLALAADIARAALREPEEFTERGRGAAIRALAAGFRSRPDAMEGVLANTMERGTSNDRAVLFGVYGRIIRDAPAETDPNDTRAVTIALERVVATLALRPDDDRLDHAREALESAARHHRQLLLPHVTTLLGAAALFAQDLDASPPPATLDDPRPEVVRGLEAHSRRNGLHVTLRQIVETVGCLAQAHSDVRRALVDYFNSLEEEHERLRAGLVDALGEMGQDREAVKVMLPALYTAMGSRSQLVRMAAARAYGEILRESGEDLPDLVHEMFLLLLSDPFVVVHQAAVRALRFSKVPDRYVAQVAKAVGGLVLYYARSRSDDHFLGEAIEVYLSLRRRGGGATPEEKRVLIEILGQMDSNAAWKAARFHGYQLRTERGYAELLVGIIENPKTYRFGLLEPVQKLGELPAADIQRVAASIPAAARAASNSEGRLTEYFLEMLGSAGAWAEAVQIAAGEAEAIDPTEWGRARRLRTQALQIAAELEGAAGNPARMAELANRWDELLIATDEDEQRRPQPSGFPFDLPLPD